VARRRFAGLARASLRGTRPFHGAARFSGRLRSRRRLGPPPSDSARIYFILDGELQDPDFRSGRRDARRIRQIARGLLEPARDRHPLFPCGHHAATRQAGLRPA